jgi:sterol O-acyltransferase
MTVTSNGVSAVNAAAASSSATDSHGTTEPAKALSEALQHANRVAGEPASPASTTSEEDYDELIRQPPPVTLLVRRRQRTESHAKAKLGRTNTNGSTKDKDKDSTSDFALLTDTVAIDNIGLKPLQTIEGAKGSKAYVLSADDEELKEILKRGLQRVQDDAALASGGPKLRRRGKFSDLVFTRKFSTFDRQNADAANSPFHGFFTLFWISVCIFMLKIGADNWRNYGNLLGTNEIMKYMFRRDVLVLLISDGVLCGMTGVSWLLQRAVLAGYVDWNRSGWVLQNMWQSIFIGSLIGWTLVRDWPWSHTVFFVLHGLVMLMKQHSYAFYNGYLSTAYKRRSALLAHLKQLELVAPVQSPSTTEPPASAISTSHLALAPSAAEMKERRASTANAQAQVLQQWRRRRSSAADGSPGVQDDIDRIAAAIESGSPLDGEQIAVFERMMRWEADALTDELRGKASSVERAYPNNLTFTNHYEYIVLPTVVYELEYPRSDTINWYYAAEKVVACFGIIFVMIMISQAFIYPVVIETLRMKEIGMPLRQRLEAFPWMLSDLIFPFMMEYMLSWYLIWETILNLLAELTYFADRSFYDAWWNSVSWDQFARDWNRPVHNFLLRHVYHSSISALKVNKHTATLITFFLSACVHELVMWCIFKKLRGYLLMLQMCQLPVSLSSYPAGELEEQLDRRADETDSWWH